MFSEPIQSTAFTGFVNGSVYGNYTKGKMILGRIFHQPADYNNRTVKSIYDYNLNDSHYRSEEDKRDHFVTLTRILY
jgi:hypothetical protein